MQAIFSEFDFSLICYKFDVRRHANDSTGIIHTFEGIYYWQIRLKSTVHWMKAARANKCPIPTLYFEQEFETC